MAVTDIANDINNILYPGTSAADVQRYQPVVNPDTGEIRKPSNEVSMDLFLKLMCAQLANQDPTQPTDDKEFLAQMASISSLQQMNALNESFSASQGYSMIGKEIYAEVYDKAQGQMVGVSGIVTAVIIQNGIATLEVGDRLIPVSSVKIVSPPGGSLLVDQLGNAAGIIGKQVKAAWQDTNEKIHLVSGVVEKIVTKPDGVYAVITAKEWVNGVEADEAKTHEVKIEWIGEIANPDPVPNPAP